MRSPKDFFRPLAVGAPEPVREIPFPPSRMIHFFPPSNPKMVAKVPDMAAKVDILLANLEDAVPASDKEAARAGLVEVVVHDLRRWTHDRHRTVDDLPYGGGPGMVMRPEPLVSEPMPIEAIQVSTVPTGKTA